MRNVQVFTLEESAYRPGKYIIVFHPDRFHTGPTSGSYAVMACRLLGISFADFCRLCRDSFGAEIIGRGSLYPVCYFDKNEHSKNLVTLLNTRANAVLLFREEEGLLCS